MAKYILTVTRRQKKSREKSNQPQLRLQRQGEGNTTEIPTLHIGLARRPTDMVSESYSPSVRVRKTETREE